MIYGRLQRPWTSIIILCLNLCCFVVFCRRIARHTIKFRSSFIRFYFTYLSTMQCCENNIFSTKPNGIGGKHSSCCQMHFCYLGYFHVYSHVYCVSIAQLTVRYNKNHLGYYIPKILCTSGKKITNTEQQLAVNCVHFHYVTGMGGASRSVPPPITWQV